MSPRRRKEKKDIRGKPRAASSLGNYENESATEYACPAGLRLS